MGSVQTGFTVLRYIAKLRLLVHNSQLDKPKMGKVLHCLQEGSCLIYLVAYSAMQHILCCVIVLFFIVLCTVCCQFLWIVNFGLPLPYSLTFIYLIAIGYYVERMHCTLHVGKQRTNQDCYVFHKTVIRTEKGRLVSHNCSSCYCIFLCSYVCFICLVCTCILCKL